MCNLCLYCGFVSSPSHASESRFVGKVEHDLVASEHLGHVAFVHGEVAFSRRARCLDICEPLGPARHRSEKLGSGFPAAVIANDIPRSDCGASPRRTC